MLWRFSFAANSTLDGLLSRETPPSVEEVMDETEVLSECKAQNNKLVNFLSREDSIRSLLHWVVHDLEDLDEQARRAEAACLARARKETDRYPTWAESSPQATTDRLEGDLTSAPLEPAKVADEALAELEGGSGRSDAEQENIMGLLNRNAPAPSDEDIAQRSRYPNVAAEILTSELWVIPETILSNKESLLRPFWDVAIPPIPAGKDSTDLSEAELYEISETARARTEFGTDEDDERDRRREVIRSLWVKVNGSLITKRTTEMIRFIQSIPNVIPRLIAQIASPAIQDITIRLVSSEEAGVFGVIQWLSEQGLVPRLIPLLSPHRTPNTHTVAADVLKAIITLCAPPPFNPLGGNMQEQQSAQGSTSGSRDNRMVREMVTLQNVQKLVGYMLDPLALTDSNWAGLNQDGTPNPADPFIIHPLPSLSSASSSVSHICTLFVELIRRNNSDFAEPHLFHTLRNRLINMRMEAGAPLGQMEEGEKEDQDRERMEDAVKGMSEAMGIVYLRYLLEVVCGRFQDLNHLLTEARVQKRNASPLYSRPLTGERFRIVELYAELLHSSNMSIFNRPPATGPVYTSDGILSGGLAGLEALGEAIDEDRDTQDEAPPEVQVTQAKELPVSSSASTDASLSGEDVALGSDDEQMLEDIEEESTPGGSPSGSGLLPRTDEVGTPRRSESMDEPNHPAPSPEDAARLRDVLETEPQSKGTSDVGGASNAAVAATTVAPSVSSVTDNEPPSPPSQPATLPTKPEPSKAADLESYPPGERLKRIYLQHGVITGLIDLFFEYPSNDFLHHVVYDVLQQILNGRIGPGLNRDLVVEMICTAKLVERVLEAQRYNDQVVAEGKRPRLGYMGHIVLIAEEIVKLLTRSPPDLLDQLSPHIPQPAWDAFVAGQLQETKARDAQPLAGGKPNLGTGPVGETSGNPSEEESSSDSEDENDDAEAGSSKLGGFGTFGEPLQRTKAKEAFVTRRDSKDSGDEDGGSEDGDANDRYWRSGTSSSRRHVDSSDEDEDDADWLRPSDDFGGFHGASRSDQMHDDFDDDETWGVFSSAGTSSDQETGDPFGDDNFAPTVSTRTASTSRAASGADSERPPPLTPHDWFDREFSAAWDSPSWQDDSGTVSTIVVPPDDEGDEASAGDGGAGLSHTPGSTWSFTGDEGDAEELPNATSPEMPQDSTMSSQVSGPASTEEKQEQLEDDMGKMEIRDAPPHLDKPTPSADEPTSPIAIPIPGRKRSAEVSSPNPLSSSPIKETSIPSPIPSRAPIATDSSPASTSAVSSSPRRSKPPPPPPSPRKRRSSTQTDPSVPPPSASVPPAAPSSGLDAQGSTSAVDDISSGNASSPPTTALVAATSVEEPLGPGVSPDVEVTDDGMLTREVDGKEVTVPKDEVVRGVEEAVGEEIRERRASQGQQLHGSQ